MFLPVALPEMLFEAGGSTLHSYKLLVKESAKDNKALTFFFYLAKDAFISQINSSALFHFSPFLSVLLLSTPHSSSDALLSLLSDVLMRH